MKKILALILCLELISLPAYSVVVDEFVEQTLDKSMEINKPVKTYIKDTFVEATLDKNLKIKYVEHKSLSDDFAEQNKNKNFVNGYVVDYAEILPKVASKRISKKVVVFDTNSMTPVFVRIKKDYTTRNKIQEGDFVDFELVRDVKINHKTYPAGKIVNARIETVSLNKIMGVPSDLVIGNFSINEIPLAGEISKTGANRSLWVQPCVYGLSWVLGLGLLFIPIRGGHAKIKTSKIYTLYAE